MHLQRHVARKPLLSFRCLFSSFPRLAEKSLKAVDTNVKTAKSPKGTDKPVRNLRRTFLSKKHSMTGGNTISYSNNFDSFEQNLGSFLKIKPCTTITTGESYNLTLVIRILNSLGYNPVSLIPDEIVSFKYLHNGHRGDIMVLGQNGSVVSWGFDETCLTENILPLISPARVNPLAPKQFESEDMDYVELENSIELEQLKSVTHKIDDGSFIEGDLIVINSTDSEQGLLDKAAFSSGMSRSTRLAVLEGALETHIEKTREFTELLSIGKKLNLTESDVLKYTGRLFLMRGKLNLYSELIETPDLYWSEPQLEKIYKQISKNLDIHPRITILNTKLDYATDESRALMAVLNEKKSTRLEWIIIYLITIEVCFELYHFYEKYYLGI